MPLHPAVANKMQATTQTGVTDRQTVAAMCNTTQRFMSGSTNRLSALEASA
jgi:hypothetical protein